MGEAAETARAPVSTRPPHYPSAQTRDTVRHLVAFGLDDDQISYVIRCLPSEVRQHYGEELKHGLTRVNAQVQAVVLNNALINHDTNAAKLWLINKAHWRGGDGNRIGIGINGPEIAVDGDTHITVTERRTVIERVLTHAAALKRSGITVQGQATEVKPNGKANGRHAGNGEGASDRLSSSSPGLAPDLKARNGSGNGSKHR